MQRIDIDTFRLVDDDNEQLVMEVTSDGALIITTATVGLTDDQLRELRDHLTLILETES